MMKSALLANSTHLKLWANRREAQSTLPKVIRRLVLATAGDITHISFRADEGVQIGGWDGSVQAPIGNAFVPAGLSGWEMGTDKDPGAKANEDYTTRSKDPLGLTPALTTFVFVTPRIWKGKGKWAEERRQEGLWKDVKAYDADDIATWLEQASAVHIWLSRLLGKHPQGVEDLDSFWTAWANITMPPLSHQFMTAGRQATVDRCNSWVNGQPSVFALQSETVDDAISFFASCLKSSSGSGEKPLVRSIVVNDLDAWNMLSSSSQPLLLIPKFPDRSRVTAAVASGHHVLIPLGQNEPTLAKTHKLPRLGREEVLKALGDMGVEEKDRYKAAKLARTSVMALRRSLAVNPAILIPKWAAPEHARDLLAALLAGQWDESNVADQQIIANLAGRSYQEYRNVLVRWANELDPPLRQIGHTWTVIAKEDTWALLVGSLTTNELEQLESAAIEVESEIDPKFEMAPDDQWLASVHNKVPKYSAPLRMGLADTLAMMAAFSQTFPLNTPLTGQEWADRIIHQVFEKTTSWQAWSSLGKALPLLAEASPSVFLRVAENDLAQAAPMLAHLFVDGDPLFSHSPHTELLWALECLAWSPEYLGKTAIVLAKLVRIDPGGRLANRPLRSLREIFLSWHPSTGVSTEKRLHVLDTIRKKEPEPAWTLLCELFPEHWGTASPTSEPHYRDWKPAIHPNITNADVYNSVVQIVRWAREDADANGDRWVTLIASIDHFPQPEFDETVKTLGSISSADLQYADRMKIWAALRSLISRHREFSDADWALPANKVAELEREYLRFSPIEVFEKFCWLFSNSPSLPEGNSRDWDEGQKTLEARRSEAIDEIVGSKGITSIPVFAEQVEHPGHLGYSLGMGVLNGLDELSFLSETIGTTKQKQRDLGFGFLQGRMVSRGKEWLDGIRSRAEWKGWSPQLRADCLKVLPFSIENWQALSSEGEETERLYWSQVGIWGRGTVDADIRDYATKEFIRVGRLATAIRFMWVYSHRSDRPPDPKLALDVLEGIAKGKNKENEVKWGELAHDIADLLQLAERTPDVEQTRLATLEWLFFPLLRHDHPPKILLTTLSSSPAFFVDILTMVYRAKGEQRTEPTEEQRTHASHGYELLDQWSTPPGIDESGVIDSQKLMSWVKGVRELAAKCGRSEVADLHIGQMLSRYPAGNDGAWPHEAVRDLLESVESDQIERGISLGVHNSRGFHARGLHDGGKQEREIAERYRNFATALADGWSRTSHLMKTIAESYESEGRREDLQTELMDELWD